MVYNNSRGIDHSYSNVIFQKLLARTKRKILNILRASNTDAFFNSYIDGEYREHFSVYLKLSTLHNIYYAK